MTLDLRADPVDWNSMAGWKRLASMGLLVCLTIPMLAASGLAVPLPSVVYRVAVGVAERTQAVAGRVPGFDAVVTETKQVARRGTIRFSAEELAVAARPGGAASSADGAAASGDKNRAGQPRRASRPTGRPVRGPSAMRRGATRARPLPARLASPVQAEADGSRPAAAPESENPPASDSPARDERPQVKRDHAPAADPGGPATAHRNPPETRTPRDEPRANPPKDEPRNTPGAGPAPPAPPTPAPPPVTLPPVPVTPPIDPLPDPLPLTPKAQLEAIAAELREIAGNGDDDGGRVAQAVDKVESAVERLEKSPPDNQGAVGDIKNAIQKLDAALDDGEIDLATRTLFVTRLNAVSAQLKGTS
jgi:hypothetical protein